MRLRTRFIILFSIILLTFSAIGSYTYFSFQKIRNITKTENSIHKLHNLVLEMKKYESNFIHWDLTQANFYTSGESSNIQNFDINYKYADAICDKLLSDKKAISIAERNRILQIKRNLKKYSNSFDHFIIQKKELGFKNWGIIGEMRESIHGIEHEINKMYLPALAVHMLMLRRHEKDYLLRRDIAYKSKFDNEYEAFKSSIYQLNINKNKKNELIEKLETYHQMFYALIKKDNEVGTNLNTGFMGKLENDSKESIESIKTVSSIITNKTNIYINRIITLLIIFILSFSLIAISSGVFIFIGILNIMGGEPEDVAKIAKNIAKGKVNMNLESSKNYKGLMKSVVLMTEKLTTIISNITLNAEQLELSSRQFSQSAHLISEGTYTQATSVDEITATIEQISKTSSINAENAGNTSTIATKVKDDIKKVKENTKESVKNGRIIEEKLKIVNSIATQTTILALNAAVEAARAGNQGAGFQVIATEVKRLAQVSKEAANEINELTTVNLKQTELVDKIVESIILPVEKTNQLVDSISVSSKEQQFGIMHIKTAAGNLYKISQENAASSEQMAANSTQLEEQAKELKKIISYFQVNNKAILNLKKKKKINKVIQLWKKERKYEKAII